jgi:hypothetical protein
MVTHRWLRGLAMTGMRPYLNRKAGLSRDTMSKVAILALAGFLAFGGPASAFELAQDLTCDQAVAYYEKNHVIYVLTHNVVALPITVGVPVNEPEKLQCPDRGQYPRPYTVETKDRWRCVIAVTC